MADKIIFCSTEKFLHRVFVAVHDFLDSSPQNLPFGFTCKTYERSLITLDYIHEIFIYFSSYKPLYEKEPRYFMK